MALGVHLSGTFSQCDGVMVVRSPEFVVKDYMNNPERPLPERQELELGSFWKS